jgi:hypothetical protein
VFSNHALPASWLTGGNVVIGGETYAVSKTLRIAKKGLTTRQTALAKAGIASSSGVELEFQLDDTWLDITSRQVFRASSKKGLITASADVDDTSLTVNAISGWSSGNKLYAGMETCTVNGAPSAGSIPVTRGRFGSTALAFPVGSDGYSESAAAGCIFADHPLTLTGRVLSLWMGTGKWSGGTFTPNNGTIESTDDQLVFRGVIRGVKPTADTQHVRLKLVSLDSLLTRQVCTRLPTATLGWPSGYIGVDDTCWDAPMRLSIKASTLSEIQEFEIARGLDDGLRAPVNGARLRDDVGLYEEGLLYSYDDVGRALSSMANFSARAIGGWDVTFSIGESPDGEIQLTVSVSTNGAATARSTTIVLRAIEGSVWRLLGFTSDRIIEIQSQAINTVETVEVVADRAKPRGYVPRHAAGGLVWYTDKRGPDFVESPGHKRAFGDAQSSDLSIPPYVRLGLEVVKVSGFDTAGAYYIDSGTQIPARYLRIEARGQLGSSAWEHYAETGEDDILVEQGLAFPLTGLPDAWLYLLLGGSGVPNSNDSTYDRDWYGGSAYIPSAFVDSDSFELQSERLLGFYMSQGLSVFEPTALRELLTGDAILGGVSIVAGADQIRLVDMSPPDPSLSDDAVLQLDSTNCRTIGDGGNGIPLDMSEDRIVNTMSVDYAWDPGQKKYKSDHTAQDTTSIGTWGRSKPFNVRTRSSRFLEQVSDGCRQMLGAYSRPYAVVDVEVSTPLWYTVDVGDIVTLTHEKVPTFSSGNATVTVGRGVTSQVGRVVSTERYYPRDGRGTVRGKATLIFGGTSDAQPANWCPAARCTSRSGAILTVDEHRFSSELDTKTDAKYFPNTAKVRLRTFDGSTTESATVSSTTNTTIVLTGAPLTVTTPPFIVEFDDFDTSGLLDSQKAHSYGCGDDFDLDDSAAVAQPPRRYA